MQKLLVPVLLLATVALSSSNVLPILSMNELNSEQLNVDYQQNDNTYSDIHQRNKPDSILFNIDFGSNVENTKQGNNLNRNEDMGSMSKDVNYDIKGFRKEQWHNYPRQLDRLNRYLYEHYSTDKRNLDPDDPDDLVGQLEGNINNITPNEFHLDNDMDSSNINNEAEVADDVINPLLIFKIHLACYHKDLENYQSQEPYPNNIENDNVQTDKNENRFANYLSPESNVIKVKREDKMHLEDESLKNPIQTRKMDKRLFSLWSRLQSLNPKGHQLHHRRHMYALYGPPDTEGGGPPPGILTAETRATFMRPPGSPLRWG